MERSSRQKINKATETLNDTIEQIELIDIFRTFHPKKTHTKKSPKKQNTCSFQVHIQVHMDILQERPHTRTQNKPQ